MLIYWPKTHFFKKEFIDDTTKNTKSKHNEKNTQQSGSIAGFENENKSFLKTILTLCIMLEKPLSFKKNIMTRAYSKYYSCLDYGSSL